MDTHIVVTGKGGVGKSFAACQLHQYFSGKGLVVHGFDTDPVNATYAQHEAFDVTTVPLLDSGNTVDPRNFDVFFEHIAGLPDDNSVVVVDNGTSSFLPFCSYMASCPALPLLEQRGTVYLHATFVGSSITDSWDNLGALARAFPETSIVVWHNPYFGKIVNKDGQKFEEMPEFKKYHEHIHAVVKVPTLIPATYGKDMEALMARRQSYEDAIQDDSGQWSLMAKQRLMIIRRDMAAALDSARIG